MFIIVIFSFIFPLLFYSLCRIAGSGNFVLREQAKATVSAHHKARHHCGKCFLPAFCCSQIWRWGTTNPLLQDTKKAQACTNMKQCIFWLKATSSWNTSGLVHVCMFSPLLGVCAISILILHTLSPNISVLFRILKNSASSSAWTTWPRWLRQQRSGRSTGTCWRSLSVEPAAAELLKTD